MQRLIIASNNTHKTNEMINYLAVLGMEGINYRQVIDQIAFPPETTDDMAQNALVKAQTIHQLLPNEYVLADDSALFIPAIPDHFGVTTMREFKAHQLRGDDEINQYVLQQLPSDASRKAYLLADFVVISPANKVYTSQGKGGVKLVTVPRGNRNGLDELLETENGLTLAEIDMPERVHYAHRGRAAIKMKNQLQQAGELEKESKKED
ncbi:non-canonical purine NTP pyrophosphatase [Weissella bombi]|uniref:XTP/dITP diphosphohydrolase n=1 Tax=Weissella bombi TaxID=1505725 RepID=A0A1C3ZCW0_9LACO|nr:non-canonical purine NTP pyrophosphatase [Weissella bombi]SCB80227.1 XTP/dITP diphosphohydrolase [Weissella bombi]